MLLLLPSAALAWSEHYLMTDAALANASVTVDDETVRVEPLDAWLAADAAGVAKTFADYYAWLADRKATRFTPQTFDTSRPDTAVFLRAARLNPDATFPLVVRRLPGAIVAAAVPPQDVSPFLVDKAPWVALIEATPEGTELRAGEVMATFADEPDWGEDHQLWPLTDYGYGEQAFGNPTGESSKAPFHMWFAHENFLVQLVASDITYPMVLERTELFLRLSREAFASGHPYWGWRLAGDAVHYIQDLCQPYHARAIPGVGFGYYLSYAVSAHQDEMKAEATSLSANRHYLYEDYVAYAMQQSYVESNASYSTLRSAVQDGRDTLEVDDLTRLYRVVTRESAGHARRIDRTLENAFGEKWTRDATIHVDTDPAYSILSEMEAMKPDEGEVLLEQSGKDFSRTGAATRALVRMARGTLSN